MRKLGFLHYPINLGVAGRVRNVKFAAADRFYVRQRRPDKVIDTGILGSADRRRCLLDSSVPCCQKLVTRKTPCAPLNAGFRVSGRSVAPPLRSLLIAAAEQSLHATASRELEFEARGRRARAFVQFLAPPPHLLICGAGPDAEPVVSITHCLGWRVTLIDHRPAYVVDGRFPGAEVRLAEACMLRSVVEVRKLSHRRRDDPPPTLGYNLSTRTRRGGRACLRRSTWPTGAAQSTCRGTGPGGA